MAWWNDFGRTVGRWLFDASGMFDSTPEERMRVERMAVFQDYARGLQVPQLTVKAGKPDDNIIVNLSGKTIDKSTTLLFGKEVKFEVGNINEGGLFEIDEKKTAELTLIWKKNKKNIFLYKLGLTGGAKGTPFLKILPDEFEKKVHRLVSLDPLQMRIFTDPQDIETVWAYRQLWKQFITVDGKEKEAFFKEVTSWDNLVFNPKNETLEVATFRNDDGIFEEAQHDGWIIRTFEKSSRTANKWQEILVPTLWKFNFPPIDHGQNLPQDESPYGLSDLDDAVSLQDRINYVDSNYSKIIRYHAHPKTIGVGFSKNQVEGQEMGADQMLIIPTKDGKVFNLEMQSELDSSLKFIEYLTRNFNFITSTVDLSSMKDKIGQITNFGLRVLYQDAIEKLMLKREMYGDLLIEVNRRMLEINGSKDSDKLVINIIWPTNLIPQNEKEESDTLTSDVKAGFVSIETAAKKRGYNFSEEKALIDEESEREGVNEGNVGDSLLRIFRRGQ